jgi:hypothetical protein
MGVGIILLAWGGVDMANAYKNFRNEETYRKGIAGAAKKAAIGVGLVGLSLPVAYILAMYVMFQLLAQLRS